MTNSKNVKNEVPFISGIDFASSNPSVTVEVAIGSDGKVLSSRTTRYKELMRYISYSSIKA
ncbi:hypothetical protein HZP83_08490 [Elizabethkingia anophelis]|nr:hypothetical protein [Elizabethkingia anophelis]MCT4090934.1 hypothetical protein [Elizabethkingia anophelis]